MAMINKQHVTELAGHFNELAERKGVAVSQLARDYREQGHSPVRFRWDLYYASTPTSWRTAMADATPGLTDSAIDTAIRSALKELNTPSNWAASLPMKR